MTDNHLKKILVARIRKRTKDIATHYTPVKPEPSFDNLGAYISKHAATLNLNQKDSANLESILADTPQLNLVLECMTYNDLFLIDDCLMQIQAGFVGHKQNRKEEVLFMIAYIVTLIYGFQYFMPVADVVFGRNNSGTGPIVLIVPFLIIPGILVGVFQHFLWNKLSAFKRGILGNGLGLGFLPALIILLIVL